jgi:hypothetical protein
VIINTKVKKSAWVASAMLCAVMAAAPVAMAQSPKEHAPKPRPDQEALLPSSTIEGRVTRYLITPMGDVEGVLLDSGTVARLPAHMGKELVGAVNVGDAVNIAGIRDKESTSFRVYSITNTQSKQTVVKRDKKWTEVNMPRMLRSMGLKELTANGEVQTMLTGPRGDPQGVILDDGTVVRFGKQAVYAASAQMKIGAKMAAKGYGTENEYGRAIDANAIGDTPETMKTVVR